METTIVSLSFDGKVKRITRGHERPRQENDVLDAIIHLWTGKPVHELAKEIQGEAR